MSRDTDDLRAQLLADLSGERSAPAPLPVAPARLPVPAVVPPPSPAVVVTVTPLRWSRPRVRLSGGTRVQLGPVTLALH